MKIECSERAGHSILAGLRLLGYLNEGKVIFSCKTMEEEGQIDHSLRMLATNGAAFEPMTEHEIGNLCNYVRSMERMAKGEAVSSRLTVAPFAFHEPYREMIHSAVSKAMGAAQASRILTYLDGMERQIRDLEKPI